MNAKKAVSGGGPLIPPRSFKLKHVGGKSSLGLRAAQRFNTANTTGGADDGQISTSLLESNAVLLKQD